MRTLSRTAPCLGAAAAALVLFAGCPAGPPKRRPAGAPAKFSYPKGEKIPGYEGLVAGRSFVFTLPFLSQRVDVVQSITDAELILERRTSLGNQPQDPREIHEALVSSGEAFLPGGTNLEAFTKVSEETLVVSGQSFDCDVYEAKGAGRVDRYWIAPRYPFVVRSTSNEIKTLELSEILDHPPAPKLPAGKPISLPVRSPAAPVESGK